ncbi:23S rRNA (adenine(1618)-N(6))-methyltransferase RlmF [Litoribacillus peritrichatus]|uniref:Ribosomal RNA large subunit methyltransferase F n=1 Tax=Litoribacillus peritrichatus TaxID=718191 RepID=A0ABP7M648_9GAMM
MNSKKEVSKHGVTGKPKLHPRNPHHGRYDLAELCASQPDLKTFITLNPKGEQTIDFANQQAVKALNSALLKHFYHVEHWDLPKDFLCPPIPGRADYIHYLADLLADSNNGETPHGKHIKGLDIGTGANLIYPIIATHAYQWKMTGTEVNKIAFNSAKLITEANPRLRNSVSIRQQKSEKMILNGVINSTERFHFTMCNPPFHASAEEAQAGTQRKNRNLNKGKNANKARHQVTLNFGGQQDELWCEGGETAFIKTMITESTELKDQCLWFTSLVSKKEHLTDIYRALKKAKAVKFRTIEMAQGQKVSRFIAWTFQPQDEHSNWFINP